jgi:hypothetical protein
MFDYDMASKILPISGTADDQTEDGSVFTAVVNDETYSNFRSLTFLAVVASAIAYSAAAWVVRDSDDGVTYADVDTSLLINPKPADQTQTSKVHHIGYIGKKKYVKAAFNSGSPTGQVTAILGHPKEMPIFRDAFSGLEDGASLTFVGAQGY